MEVHLFPSMVPIWPGIFKELSAHPPPLTEGSSLHLEDTEEEDKQGRQGIRGEKRVFMPGAKINKKWNHFFTSSTNCIPLSSGSWMLGIWNRVKESYIWHLIQTVISPSLVLISPVALNLTQNSFFLASTHDQCVMISRWIPWVPLFFLVLVGAAATGASTWLLGASTAPLPPDSSGPLSFFRCCLFSRLLTLVSHAPSGDEAEA